MNQHNILLLMEHQENRYLLKKLLKKKYKNVFNDLIKLERKTDLIIIDENSIFKHESWLEEYKKQAEPYYLPILLISSNMPVADIYAQYSIIIDDLIKTPVGKEVLLNRIENLLNIRSLSRLAEENYYALAESSPAGICIVQATKIIYANDLFSEIVDLPKSEVIGKKITNFIKNNSNGGTRLLNFPTEKWVDCRQSIITYKGRKAHLYFLLDITEQKKLQGKLEYLSFHDKLTGLYNRAFFEEELKRLNTERQFPLSIIMGDMNSLKLVNDAFGHQKGNFFLKKAGQILKNCCRKEDIIARLGGDEFAVLLPKTNPKTANEICNRIEESCSQTDTSPIKLSIALGIATVKEETDNIDQVLKEVEDNMYRNKIAESESISNSIISTLEITLHEKTHETAAHAKRMINLAVKFGTRINLSANKLNELKLLAKLHDIGKVAIPENILTKPGRLTEEEYEIVKGHPESGYRIVKSVPALAAVADGVLSHHERWDGKGYPRGIKGNMIPLIAKMIAIVDTFDVMTHDRSYKQAASKEEALIEIKKCSGTQFDPKLVNIFLKLMRA